MALMIAKHTAGECPLAGYRSEVRLACQSIDREGDHLLGLATAWRQASGLPRISSSGSLPSGMRTMRTLLTL